MAFEFTLVNGESSLKTRLELENTVYVGGSNETNLEEFQAYVNSKNLTPISGGKPKRASEVFKYCLYFKVTDAKSMENKFLKYAEDRTKYNSQTKSNLDSKPGFVYVLVP